MWQAALVSSAVQSPTPIPIGTASILRALSSVSFTLSIVSLPPCPIEQVPPFDPWKRRSLGQPSASSAFVLRSSALGYVRGVLDPPRLVIALIAIGLLGTLVVVGLWIYPLSVIAMICIYGVTLIAVVYSYRREPLLSSIVLAMFLLALAVNALLFVLSERFSMPVRVGDAIGSIAAALAFLYMLSVIRNQTRPRTET